MPKRSEEHTSELQSRSDLVCRLLLEKKNLPDGHRLYWRLDDFTDPWKSAATVLLIHGFAATSEAWRAWVPHLAREYRVRRIARRGFGKSDPMPADFAWSLDRMVDDTVSFIEAHAATGA